MFSQHIFNKKTAGIGGFYQYSSHSFFHHRPGLIKNPMFFDNVVND